MKLTMSESRLRRIEEKLNALIPKAQWLLSNFSSAGTGPCAPCPPCVAGETPATAVAVTEFTPLDPEFWPFLDNETSTNFKTKLKQPEYIHFFTSQKLDRYLKMMKAGADLPASAIRLLILSQTKKVFKTRPENKVELGKSETVKPLLVFTPETYVNFLQNPLNNIDENAFVRITNFFKKLLKNNNTTYKPFQDMKTKDFDDLYTVFQNLYQSLQAGGCNENKLVQDYFIQKKEKDAREATEKITADAKAYFNIVTNTNYQQRQENREQGKPYKFALKQYEPFENFDEWNWVQNALKAAESYYAQSERENPELYPFTTFQEWKNEFDSRTGGPITTQAESLAAAKHYRDGGSINETYLQRTLKDWNDARIAAEGPRVIVPSEEIPQTPEWCFVALTSLFTQHPYVINYFKENRIPIEIPKEVGRNLQQKKVSQDRVVANAANDTLSGKVIFSVLLNFVTTYEPLQANLASILAGGLTDPTSYDLFAAYLKQKPLPETPPENMAAPEKQAQTIPSSGTLPETMGPKLNSLQRKQQLEEEEKSRQLQAARKPQTAAELKKSRPVGNAQSMLAQLRSRGEVAPVTDTYGQADALIERYSQNTTSRTGGLRKHGRKSTQRRNSNRRRYAKSPLHPFF
jgi:hypothetical protein